jgi:hypothetical protein
VELCAESAAAGKLVDKQFAQAVSVRFVNQRPEVGLTDQDDLAG